MESKVINKQSEIYEFTDYVEVKNVDGINILLCPSEKMARPINNTDLVRIYEFFEDVTGGCQNQIEAVVSQAEWDRIKIGKNSIFRYRKDAIACDSQTHRKIPHLEGARGKKISDKKELIDS